MCCKVLPQKNMCCLVSLSPFKKSAMSEIYLLSGFFSSFVFFFLLFSALSFLLLLWGWERWLFDSTFLLWTDSDDRCFAGCLSFSFSGTTRAPDDHLPHLLHGVASPGGFVFFFFFSRCFRVLLFSRPKRRFCSFLVSAFPCLVFSPSGGLGCVWCFVLFPPSPAPPPLACLLRLASTLATRCKEPWRLRPATDPTPHSSRFSPYRLTCLLLGVDGDTG